MRFGIYAALAVLLSSLAGATRGDASPVPPSFEIYSVGLGGAGVRNVTHSPLDENSPALSPNGRQIAFIRTIAGNRDLWIMNADGSGAKQLTSSADEQEWDPAWSPGGGSIAFTAATRDSCPPPHPCPAWSVRVVRPDGSGVREIAVGARSARWSPDGRKLVLETDIDPYQEAESIAVVPLAGGAHKIIETTDVVAHPVWSATGRIAFIRGGESGVLYTARADGGARRRIIKDAEDPEWSPSGRRIAFMTLNRLRMVGARGGRARTIAWSNGFAWSRNGRRIALFREQGRIATIGPDGKAFRVVKRIADRLDTSWLGPWTWSPNGRRLVYAARVQPSPPPG